jgi:hypothetical protein
MCQNLDFRFLSFITFCHVFSLSLFVFFNLTFYYLLSFLFGFLSPFIFPLFFTLVLYLFFYYVILSLVYLNLLGNKKIGYFCCCSLVGGYIFSCSTQMCNQLSQHKERENEHKKIGEKDHLGSIRQSLKEHGLAGR